MESVEQRRHVPVARAPRPRRWVRLAVAGLVLAGLTQISGTHAAFVGQTVNASTFAANPDWRPPTVSAVVIQKTEGYTPGYVRAGGTYRVHANATDEAGPSPSGVGPLSSADVSTLTTGLTADPLSAGAATVGGTAYGFRSTTPPTVSTSTTAGQKTFTVTARDQATPTNSSAPLGGTVTVDNTVPAPSGLTAVNVGTGRQPNQGDVLTLTFNDVVETQTVLTAPANWDGSATTGTVTITDGGTVAGAAVNDVLRVLNSNIGTIDLGNPGYVTTAGGVATFTAGAVTWTQPSATTRALRVVLGAPSGAPAQRVTNSQPTQRWTPAVGIIDRAGNRIDTAVYREPGIADNDF